MKRTLPLIFILVFLIHFISPQEIVISNCEQLQNISRATNQNYSLTGNIDCSMSETWDNGRGFKPLELFRGTFDGKGYAVLNLFINHSESDQVGLFGFTDSGAEIKNLNVVGNIVGKTDVGGVVGRNSLGTLKNVHFQGNVSGEKNVGGLIGRNGVEGLVITSSSSGEIIAWEGSSSIGGLVGYNVGNAIINSSSDAYVLGDRLVGGLVGYNAGRLISHCSYNGTVLANGWLGGIVGENRDTGPTNPSGISYSGRRIPNYVYTGKIENCYSAGTVGHPDINSFYVGGLVGLNIEGDIINSYSDSFIMGDRGVGGLIGGNLGTVSNSYFSGDVSGAYFLGGIVGINGNGTIKNSYFNGGIWSFRQIALGEKVAGTIVGNNDDGMIENSYYYKSEGIDADECYAIKCSIKKEKCEGYGEIGCNAVEEKEYFYLLENSPIKNWDFVNIWVEKSKNPSLREYNIDSVNIQGETQEYKSNYKYTLYSTEGNIAVYDSEKGLIFNGSKEDYDEKIKKENPISEDRNFFWLYLFIFVTALTLITFLFIKLKDKKKS